MERDTAARPVAPARAATGAPVVTVEKALYALLVLVALAPRLLQLGEPPLSAREAGQALQAYRLATGAGLPAGDYSPLLLTFQFVTFALIGAGDALARLLPALAGAALVATPYWLRRWLGRPGALATAALLAVSPSFLLFSRQADEAVVTAAATLAVLAAGLRYMVARVPRRLMWLGAWLALALLSGRGAWLFTLVSLGFVTVVVFSGRDSVTGEDVLAGWRDMRAERGPWLGAALLAGGVFATLATAVFFNPGGLQAALDNLAAWARPATGVGWTDYLLALAWYETLILVFGVAGAAWLLRRRNMFAAFLLVWLLAALAASLISPARPPSGIVTFLLPLTLLAGMTLGRLVDQVYSHAAWDREGLLLLFAVPFIVGPVLQLASYTTVAAVPPDAATKMVLLAVVVVLFLSIVTSIIGMQFGADVALRGLALLVLLLLGVGMLRTATSVAFPQSYVPQEFLGGARTSPDVERTVEQVRAVALDRFGAQRTELVAVDARLTPTLLWYLRHFPRVEVRNNVAGTTAAHALAAAPAGAQAQPLPGYVGQRARFESQWQPRGLDLRGWLRWYLYRTAPTVPAREDSLIWHAKR